MLLKKQFKTEDHILLSMNKIIPVLLSVFLVLTAFIQLPDLMQYDSKRVMQIVILFVIGLLVLVSIIKSYLNKDVKSFTTCSHVSKSPVAATAILFLTGLMSVFLSTNIQFALLEFTFLFLLLSLAVLIAPRRRKTHHFSGRLILGTTLIYSLIYIIIFFGNYISSFYEPMITLWPNKYDFSLLINGIEFHGKEVLYFDHKRFFNHTQTWTLPLLVGLTAFYKRKEHEKLQSILLIVLASFWWMLIFASGGRGSMLSLILSLGILTMIWGKDLIPFLKFGSISLVLGALNYLIIFRWIPSSNADLPLLRSSDSGRLDMWQRALESWLQNPLFGIGPMHYSKLESAPTFAHPHNFYIQFLTEWGLIAFIALAFLIGFLVKNVIDNYPDKNQKFQSRFLYISVSWSLSAALIHAFFSGVFHTPLSQIWFVLLISWLIGFNRKKSSGTQFNTVRRYASFTYVVLILIVSSIVYDDVLTIYQGYEEYISNYPESKFYPRFWRQGLFE